MILNRDGYIVDTDIHAGMDCLRLDDIIEAGERLPGIVALWEVAIPEERREMVLLLLEPGGLYSDLEMKEIAALKSRPAFLPMMRLIDGLIEYKEATGTPINFR
jgi:site-specific DNA recombinase